MFNSPNEQNVYTFAIVYLYAFIFIIFISVFTIALLKYMY